MSLPEMKRLAGIIWRESNDLCAWVWLQVLGDMIQEEEKERRENQGVKVWSLAESKENKLCRSE